MTTKREFRSCKIGIRIYVGKIMSTLRLHLPCRFCLILKLLLVNGSIWIVEIISWYLQTDYEEVGLVSFVLDVVNITQAVAIFFLFVFKNDVLNSLKRNYPSMEGKFGYLFITNRY